MGFQTITPRRRRLDGRDAIFQHDVMRRLLESQSGHPPTVHQRPRRSMVVTAMTQEEARELLTGLTQTAARRQTGAHEIADRLMSLIGNPYGGQFASPMQPGQIDRVPPIRLDPISRFGRDQRRSHDDATVPSKGQLPLNPIAARSGLITEPKLVPSARQSHSQSLQSRRRVRDLAILAHVLASARLGKRDRNRVLVHVKADICDSFVQDPSPMHEALRRNPAQPSTSLHTVRRVALSQANMWSRGARIILVYDCMLKRAANRRSPTPERRKFNEAARIDQGSSFFPAILGESLPAAAWAISAS